MDELSRVHDDIAGLLPNELEDADREALVAFSQCASAVENHANELADFEGYLIDRTERGLDPLPQPTEPGLALAGAEQQE